MLKVNNLGFPRIGRQREFKFLTEKFFRGEIEEAAYESGLAELREANWRLQQQSGVDLIPSNDFSRYDHVLDMCCIFDIIPSRFLPLVGSTERYFAMARGDVKHNVTALEMSKWFDTNYHYLVPEFSATQQFRLAWNKPLADFNEALAMGITTKPVLLGPVSLLCLGKAKDGNFDPLIHLPKLLPAYGELLISLAEAGAEYIQIDEPYLALDCNDSRREAYRQFFRELPSLLTREGSAPKIILTSYFAPYADNLSLILENSSGWDFLHIDSVRASEDLNSILQVLPQNKGLSVGIIDGRNIWRTDLNACLDKLKNIVAALGSQRVMIAPSCSLLHVPIDVSEESQLNTELKDWLAFGVQKLQELDLLKRCCSSPSLADLQKLLEQNATAIQARRTSTLVNRSNVKARCAQIGSEQAKRKSPFTERVVKQNARLNLPLYPTTTIGSFPQTEELRQRRSEYRAGKIDEKEYDAYIRACIVEAIRWQEEIHMDVLVHGEFERNDMVEYFGQYLSGFTTTINGWVQSYGTRCVKPPIIYGDVERLQPMTVAYTTFAQSLTEKPVKGMLTGPVTILQWSFVRDDQPRFLTTKQIALAIADEVIDLEKSGIAIIQIDEPAIREGLPLRKADWPNYLNWATEAFRLSSLGVEDTTQIHTHMCYSEFNDIIQNIAEMDADVITIETSRSQMELLEAFERFAYPNQIGPGVYDIHSPRIPNQSEMLELLERAGRVINPNNLWVNPDCGLKTRQWAEVKPALENMIGAAKILRSACVALSARQA